MSLAIVQLTLADDINLPATVRALLANAELQIQEFVESRQDNPIVAYVPCDFPQVYQALVEVENSMLSPGNRFLEWGSGLGVATCLASMLGFDAVGIEIEQDLVALSRKFASEHHVDVEFVQGSFVPEGAEAIVEGQLDVTWLRTDDAEAYSEIELEPDDFDLVFAYPWPGEEQIVFDLFERYASVGALLLTFHGQEGVRLQRKVSH